MSAGVSARLEVGDVLEKTLVEGLTRTRIVQYAGASGDYNPLHTDEVFATTVGGVPTVFAHGMLTMGMTARLLTDRFGAHRVVHYGARFVAQVWPGDTLIARATVESAIERDGATELALSLVTVNQRAEVVLSGTAVVRVEENLGR